MWPFGRTPQFLNRFFRLLGTSRESFPLTSFLSLMKALGSSRRFMATWGAHSQIKHISSAFYFWYQPDTPSSAVFCWVRMAALELGKPQRAWRQILIPLQPVTPRFPGGRWTHRGRIQVPGSTTYNLWLTSWGLASLYLNFPIGKIRCYKGPQLEVTVRFK